MKDKTKSKERRDSRKLKEQRKFPATQLSLLTFKESTNVLSKPNAKKR